VHIDDLKSHKVEIRKSVLQARNALPEALRHAAAQSVIRHFSNGITLPAKSCVSGYGAGYYDRAIAALHQKNKHPVLIGVAFDAQRVDHIAHEPHDVALDYILTETGLIAASPQG
jgi:5-formyltetrahydrofolate cyclo-ligase